MPKQCFFEKLWSFAPVAKNYASTMGQCLIPLDWALGNVFEDLDFLCAQNKPARSEIYQRHRHLNLPLDQKLHLLPQEH